METVNDSDPPPNEPPPQYREPGSRLTRSTQDKVVDGLAGGLGRYFGIDPVVFRIAFVVLTLAGGSGILLYLVGWLMVPDDAGGAALQRFGSERNAQLVAAVLAGIGLLLLVDDLTGATRTFPSASSWSAWASPCCGRGGIRATTTHLPLRRLLVLRRPPPLRPPQRLTLDRAWRRLMSPVRRRLRRSAPPWSRSPSACSRSWPAC